MKKILSIIGILLIMGLMAGCYKPSAYEEDFETVDDSVDVVGDYVEVDEEGIVKDLDDLEEMQEEQQEVEEMPEVEEEVVVEETEEVETKSASTITVKEGELVKLNVKAKDPDGDDLTYTFSKPLNSKGEWQTSFGDAGKYPVTVTVSDGKSKITQEIVVVVTEKNRAPVIEKMSSITVNEGETVKLNPNVVDPDGDKVTLKFTGWMKSAVYKTTNSDSGTYSVTVTATDEKGASVSETVSITVLDVNQEPYDIVITQG